MSYVLKVQVDAFALCHLFLQYSKEISNDKDYDDSVENNNNNDCQKG